MKHICVIDGQGGGMGSLIIKKLREKFEGNVEITALGTNALATSQMLKAGANRGASGENAIVRNVIGADFITGPVGISWAHALMGEVTPKMAEAVTGSSAVKLFIPLFQENIKIIGVEVSPLPHLVHDMIENELVNLMVEKNEKEIRMCEANAYLVNGDQETLIMESVDLAEPVDDGIRLVNIFGEQKFVKAEIHALSLVNHKILIRETCGQE